MAHMLDAETADEKEERLLEEDRIEAARYEAMTPFREGKPPKAAALGIDVSKLPPNRARLARIQSWTAGKRRELETLEAGKARLNAEISGAEKLAKSVAAKTDSAAEELARAVLKGNANLDALGSDNEALRGTTARKARAAEVARIAMVKIAPEIERLQSELAALDERLADAAQRAFIESLQPALAKYNAKVTELRALADELKAARDVVPGYGAFLPKFDDVRVATPYAIDPITLQPRNDAPVISRERTEHRARFSARLEALKVSAFASEIAPSPPSTEPKKKGRK
jgi:chromosome segregation ATPase